MIERTYREYRRVLRQIQYGSGAVLEVGARPDASTLLAAPELVGTRRVGINLHEPGLFEGIAVLGMDARRMAFPDELFDLVLCASTLEHVSDFWNACAEMKRVLAPGGRLIVSVPGYSDSRLGNQIRGIGFALGLPDWWKRATPTMRVHDAPHDYYRFSEYAFHEVILSGLEDVSTWQIMIPPRIFGIGTKPGRPTAAIRGNATES